MGLSISDDALKNVLAAAVLEAVSGPERDKLFKEALVSVLTEKEGSGYSTKTKLNRVLEMALFEFAQQVIKENLMKDESLKTQLKEIVNTATVAAFEKAQEKIAENVAYVIQKTFSGERY